MALITKPNTFVNGATIIAAQHNSNFDTIYNEFNGSISNANISASAAIVDTKLAQITTGSKVSTTAITTTTDFTSTGNWTFNSVALPETTAPSTAAGEGALYTKDTGGQPELFFREESDGDEVQLTSGGSLIGKFLQFVSTTSTAYANLGTTNIVDDDTIPTSTEGNAIAALDTAITPISATSNLEIEVECHLSTSSTDQICLLTLFQDAGTSAIASSSLVTTDAYCQLVRLRYIVTSGSTSSRTYKVRAGSIGGRSVHINGDSVSGGRKFGGTYISKMTVKEIV